MALNLAGRRGGYPRAFKTKQYSMKLSGCITLCLIGPLLGQVQFPPDSRPGNVILDKRERPVILPYNVYVKDCKASKDGDAALLLLYRYRSGNSGGADYFSLMACKRKSEDEEWSVHFVLEEAEMSERLKGRSRVVEIESIGSDMKVILKVDVLSKGDNEPGEMNWEKWDVETIRRLEVIRPTIPFEPFVK